MHEREREWLYHTGEVILGPQPLLLKDARAKHGLRK